MIEKVSVIIPTHKRPHFLSRAINSVLAQVNADVEVVVVDDNFPCSKEREKTSNVMKEFEGNERVVYVLNPKPLGGGLARNVGIETAKGDYITFLDDDDIYLPKKICLQLEFMKKHSLDMTFTDVYLHDENGQLVEFRRHSYVTDWSNKELLKQHILHSLGPTSTFMIKRSVLMEKGAFIDVPMGQDFMLMWHMIENGIKIGYMPGSQIIQYLHDGERISVGQNKINGENSLYKLKQTRMHILTPDEKKYVRFRHYAVLSVAAKRSSKPLEFIKYGTRAVFVSPSYFFKEVSRRFENRNKVNEKSA
ncbi:MAG TPA: glycosyltransferase family 2 protein [Clostridia bacterium]|nr:glycosyltransferase family 2 protein [Clostridia bacterium]